MKIFSELTRKVNSDGMYSRIKPYIYSAVLTRKREYMLNHKHYSPNIRAVLKRTEYNIHKDNGKNFNNYKAYLELYAHMRECFADESDLALSDHCFANLSNLSEWFYENCEAKGDIPMTLHQVIEWMAEMVDIWYTSGSGLDGTTVTEILTDAADLI